jgi:uncharacterized glyoxalase superfamily protein PhnB
MNHNDTLRLAASGLLAERVANDIRLRSGFEVAEVEAPEHEILEKIAECYQITVEQMIENLDTNQTLADVTNVHDIEDTSIEAQNKRRLLVAPPCSSETKLLLTRASDAEQISRIGNQTGGRVSLFLHTYDFQRDYDRYRSRGVEFVRPPKEETYGAVAGFKDRYENLWDLLKLS